MKRNDQDLAEERLEKVISHLPRGVATFIHWVREPRLFWLRLPLGLALVCGGLVGFLPVLGFWMVPLGIILLAQDFGPFRRVIYRLVNWTAKRRPRWFGESYS